MKRILALLTALTAAPLAAAEPAPMITPGPVTFAVIGAYLAFLVLMGLAFRRFNRNTGDYFRSGSQGSWWLCGASAYVSATSAYTFTVAAGIGYTVGWSILLIYALSPLQFVLLGIFYEPLCRQKRLTTEGEVLRVRFNPATQQVYTIIGLLTGYVGSGMGLYTLAIFVSAIFGFDLYGVIVILGAVVLFYSVAGGRWAVMGTDFLQCLVMIAVTVTVTILCLQELGGIGGIWQKIDELGLARDFQLFKPRAEFGDRFGGYYSWEWLVALQLTTWTSSLSVARTNYSVKDGRNARNALFLCAALQLVGSAFFFIPAFTARFLYQAQVEALPLAAPENASYAVVCLHLLPETMIGLVVVAMFAAAMSTMDTSLNGGASQFMLNVYPPLERLLRLRPRTEAEKLRLSKGYSVFAGLVAIGTAILYAYAGIGPLQLVLMIGAMLGLPRVVPLLWGLFLKRMPQWVPLGAMAAGFLMSLVIRLSTDLGKARWSYVEQVGWIFGVTSLAVFLLCILLRRTNTPEYDRRVDEFYRKMFTPVDFAREVGVSSDRVQLRIIGSFVLLGGIFVALLALLAHDLKGVLCPLGIGGAMMILGGAMLLIARRMPIPEETK